MHSDRHHQGDRPQWQQGESAVRELPSGHRPGHRADRVLRAEPRCRAAWRRSVDHAARQQSQDLRQDRYQREHGDDHRRLRAEPGRGVRRGRRRAGPDQQHLRQQDHQRRVPSVLVRHVHRNAGVEAVHEHVSCRHQCADRQRLRKGCRQVHGFEGCHQNIQPVPIPAPAEQSAAKPAAKPAADQPRPAAAIAATACRAAK